MRVLLVEDNRAMRDTIAEHLRACGFAVDAVQCGDDAIGAVSLATYDAIILDLGLPDMDGLEVLRHLRRARGADTPALILTARDAIADRVGGLDAGADDYILKPFDLTELEARLRAVLRRPGVRRDAIYSYGDLTFDPASRSAMVVNANLDLTRREASVLEELIRAAGRIVVKDTLEERLYGFDEEVSGNALEASVSRLRRKLQAAKSGIGIEAARGIGYRLQSGVTS
ncbi:response regulator transcription factor [Sphingomonas sp. 10B4]|uniref:response regulator transcription factor n=1 Tax=Sphingomonas sp. 10B4 TaxID=3048575 RepID=UPI002AB34E26|nr:response regulator transcription factor [Sphingomonas sp. 10B4]MDY7524588.1 response regulator transcription factor [Sphingomonas sp. 10B4]MEB0283999.1 response regulator transcription factor [Sphingomonas sp. 10B4]